MGGEWTKVLLGDICQLKAGGAFKKELQGNSRGELPFIKVSDMNLAGNELYINKANNWVNRETAEAIGAPVHASGAVVFAKIGVALTYNRRRILTRDTLIDNNMMSATPKTHRVDPRFFYYLLANIDFNEIVEGSALPYLRASTINSIEVSIPNISEQRAIARILGALDDKIELNRRMNGTLEAMAQALFKSWFVDFDPVVVNAIKAGNSIPNKFAARAAHYRDNPDALGLPEDILRLFPARFVDSEFGPIPEGWEVKHLADAIEIHDSKRIPLNSRERAARQGPYPYYGATGIVDYVDDYLFDGIYVLVGEDGSVIDEKGHPVTQYVWGQFWVNNHAHVLTGDGISNEHLYLILKNTNIRAFVTGAVQPKISQKNLKVIPFVHSGENISRVFASQIAEYFRKIRSINEESRTLADLRDTLLPKLISGELRVPDVEKIMEDG